MVTQHSSTQYALPPTAMPARLWEKHEFRKERGDTAESVCCRLCAKYCLLAPGQTGDCGVRGNSGGALVSLVGHSIAAANTDPVEKKPLFHFLPGSSVFSVGTLGCNFHCNFCQNSGISQLTYPPKKYGEPVTPQELVQTALRGGCRSIAYTYNEPTVFFELMQDTAQLAAKFGLRNIMVSNGYMSRECFDALNGIIHAINIDLKAFTGAFYQERCGARLQPVLQTLRRCAQNGWWLEVTTLLIPGVNDSAGELRDIAAFIATELGPDVPWHVSRFYPSYKMQDVPATGMGSISRALEAGARQGVRYVYAGNVPGHDSESTRCPACGNVLISRRGYRIEVPDRNFVGICRHCGCCIAGVWA